MEVTRTYELTDTTGRRTVETLSDTGKIARITNSSRKITICLPVNYSHSSITHTEKVADDYKYVCGRKMNLSGVHCTLLRERIAKRA